MQHTDKYQFNIIETSDAFSPEALNENARKLENALLEHKAETIAALGSGGKTARIAYGTFNGARSSITVDFKPMVMFLGFIYRNSFMLHMAFRNCPNSLTNTIQLSLTWDDRSISWTDASNRQTESTVNYYVIIGESDT